MAKIWQHFIFFYCCYLGPLTSGIHLNYIDGITHDLNGDVRGLTAYWARIISLISIMLATPVYGVLLQCVSCKTLQMLVTLIHGIAFGLYMIPSYPVNHVAVATGGIAAAGSIIVTPLYISECVGPSYRAVLMALCYMFINAGFFIGQTLLPECYTKSLYLALPSTFLYFCAYFWLPDSPVWLVLRNKIAKAENCLKKLRNDEEDIQRQILLIQEEIDVTGMENTNILNVLKDKGFRKAIYLAVGLLVTQQSLGIFLQYQKPARWSTSLEQAACAVLGAVLLKFFGRKTILVTTCLILLACEVTDFIIDITGFDFETNLYSALISLISHSVALTPVTFVMLPELLPQVARGTAIIIAAPIGTMVLFFGLLLEKSNFIPQHFVRAPLAITTIATVFVIFCLIETKDKTPVQIYDKLRGNRNEPKSNGDVFRVKAGTATS